ncbi:unnamed protein product [marine sediment metagenome]|uniref:Uncharacterized protein n=1 Tax=marine sediment metagenome TaxID=412755 RepID=X1SAS9_9ZZZZ
MTYELRVVPHSMLLGNQMAEFWRDGVFVAGIYPHEDGIQIVSKYMDGVKQVPGYPPTVVVHLSERE